MSKPIIVKLTDPRVTVIDTNKQITTTVHHHHKIIIIKNFIYGIPIDMDAIENDPSGDIRLNSDAGLKIFPISIDEGKLWCQGRVTGAIIHDGDNLGDIVEGGTTGKLTIKDEDTLINSNALILNFKGVDVIARTDTAETSQVNIFIPPPNYVSHFNTTDGSTNAIVGSWPTTNRHIADRITEGNPYKIGDWTAGEIHPTIKDTAITYHTNEQFSCIDNSTEFSVKIFDADGTSELASNILTLDNNKDITNNHIRIQVTNFETDTDRYKCSVNITIYVDDILSNGGRFSVELKHDNKSDGVYVKTQDDIFYDPNINKPSIGAIAFTETSGNIITKQISGVYYYTLDSQFTVNISDIDWLNDRSYPDIQVELNGSQYGLSGLYLHGTDLQDWENFYNDVDDSYSKSDWKITQTNMCKVGSGYVSVRYRDWTTGIWKNTPPENICINTYSDNSTRIYEDFRLESKRLTTTFETWDSTQSLLTYNGGSGLQVQCSRLIYPNTNFQDYLPESASQPDYSSATGDRLFIRQIWHNDVSHSNGRFQLGDHNITEDDLTNKDVEIWISLDGTSWYSCNDDYTGGALDDGDGCRTNRDQYNLSSNNQIAFTFGLNKNTDESTGGGWGMYIKIIYKDNATGRSKYLGNISEVTWL